MTLNRLVKEHWEGLAKFGVIAVRLVPNEKVTTRGWGTFLDLHDWKGETRLDLVEEWLCNGYGVGYLPRGGVYVIDCDVPKGMSTAPMLERLEDFCASNRLYCPRIATPGGGAHCIAQLPTDLSRDRLKNHVCHPTIDGERQPWDWKLYERTLVVGPGTIVEKGGRQRAYEPATPWFDPPVIHPHWVEPGLDLYRPEDQPFLRYTRPLESRVVAATRYLQKRAPVSISGKNGNRTLSQVAAHLVAYYDLDPSLAFWLLTNENAPGGCWNSRCKGEGGKPHPWSKRDLYDALERAVDAVPAYGRELWKKAQQQAYRDRCYQDFIEILAHLPSSAPGSEPWMYSGDLFAEFIRVLDLDSARFDPGKLGRWLNRAIEGGKVRLERTLKGKARLAAYRGVNASLLAQALLRHREAQQQLPGVS